jgi:general stress protein 26
MTPDQTEKFRELLNKFDTAVLITHGTDHAQDHFHSRPMAISFVDENCDIWFVTDRDSSKVHEIEADSRCHVVCQNGHSSCLSISGRATVVHDRDKIRALWKPDYLIWFPVGQDDPNIALVHVVGERGEYWDNTGLQAFIYVYRAIKAVMTGTVAEVTEGEQHGVVDLANGKSQDDGAEVAERPNGKARAVKTLFVALLLLGMSAGAADWVLEPFTPPSGTVVSNAVIVRINTNGIAYKYKDGMGTVPFASLHPTDRMKLDLPFIPSPAATNPPAKYP